MAVLVQDDVVPGRDRIVVNELERAVGVVNGLAKAAIGVLARHVEEAIEAVGEGGRGRLRRVLNGLDEQPIELAQIARIGEVLAALDHERVVVGDVVLAVGREIDDAYVAVLAATRRVVRVRGEEGLDARHDLLDNAVLQVQAHLVVQARRVLEVGDVGVYVALAGLVVGPALISQVELGLDRVEIADGAQIETTHVVEVLRVLVDLGRDARHYVLVVVEHRHVLVLVHVVQVALVEDDVVEDARHWLVELAVALEVVEGLEVRIAGVVEQAEVDEQIGQLLDVIDLEHVLVLVEDAVEAHRVRNGVVADDDLVVAHLLAHLEPPLEVLVRLAVLQVVVALAAYRRVALLRLALHIAQILDLELDWVHGRASAVGVLDERHEPERATTRQVLVDIDAELVVGRVHVEVERARAIAAPLVVTLHLGVSEEQLLAVLGRALVHQHQADLEVLDVKGERDEEEAYELAVLEVVGGRALEESHLVELLPLFVASHRLGVDARVELAQLEQLVELVRILVVAHSFAQRLELDVELEHVERYDENEEELREKPVHCVQLANEQTADVWLCGQQDARFNTTL